MPSSPSTASSPWAAEIAYRMRRHLVWKLLGTTAWTSAFFIGYFHVLRHPAYPVFLVPATTLDTLVPFVSFAIVPYLSLWIYVGIAPGLQRTFGALLAYGAWAALLCAAGLAIFWRWPTQIAPALVEAHGFPGFDLMKGIDAPGNACPSMHVAIAMFSAVWIDRLFAECRVPRAARWINWAWFAAITWSTLATRQHVALDAAAGALLGAVFALASLRWPIAGRAAAGGHPGGTDMMAAASTPGGERGMGERPPASDSAGRSTQKTTMDLAR